MTARGCLARAHTSRTTLDAEPRSHAGERRTALRAIAVVLAMLAWLGGAALGAPAADRKQLTVFAAASLAEAFGAIGKDFERAHPGVRVRFAFAGSQVLAAQLAQGAAADVFASADARWMDHVRRQGLVAGQPELFTGNRLVLLLPRGNPARIARLADLARPGIKLVIGAPAVPAGAYTRTAIAKLARLPGYPPGWEAKVLANVVSQEENVRGVVGKVVLGEADAGFAYRSDVGASARSVRVLPLPDAAHVLALYPIAALAKAPEPVLAGAFVARVRGSEGQKVLARHGFLPLLELTPSR